MAVPLVAIVEALVSAIQFAGARDAAAEQKAWRDNVSRQLNQILENSEMILKELRELRIWLDEKFSEEIKRTIPANKELLDNTLVNISNPLLLPQNAANEQIIVGILTQVHLATTRVINDGYANYLFVSLGFAVVNLCYEILIGWGLQTEDQRAEFRETTLEFLYSCLDETRKGSFREQLIKAESFLAHERPYLGRFEQAFATSGAAVGQVPPPAPHQERPPKHYAVGVVMSQLGYKLASISIISEWTVWLSGNRTNQYEIRGFDSESTGGGLHQRIPKYDPANPGAVHFAGIVHEGVARDLAHHIFGEVNAMATNVRWAEKNIQPLKEHIASVIRIIQAIEDEDRTKDRNAPTMRLLLGTNPNVLKMFAAE